MKLRTKLLLGVGLLLFAMVIAMYVLPAYLVQQDISNAADEIHALLVEDQKELVRSQQLWLQDALNRNVQNIDSILFMLYEGEDFSKQLLFDEKNADVNVWDGIARLAGYDPEIAFVQAHSPSTGKAAVISPHAAPFYPISHFPSEKELDLFALSLSADNETLYVGIELPKELQTEAGYTLYAIVDLKHAPGEKRVVEEEIEKITPELSQERIQQARRVLFTQVEGSESAYLWAIKIDLIRDLAPLFVEGLRLDPDKKPYLPEGIARIDTSGSGIALLTDDLFQTTPLFDDRAYFESHPPKPDSPPLAEGSVLITSERGDHAYVANTLRNDQTFLTIGVSLSRMIQQLALSSNKMILLQLKKDFWIGFDSKGRKLTIKEIDAIIKTGLQMQQQGKITFDGQSYYFDRLLSLEEGELVFYELHSSGREQSILATLNRLEQNLTQRISWQLSLVSFAAMILVLLFVARIGFGVIKPITKLALATEEIVAGKYEAVKLPNVGRRRDEVAILIHSFREMVHGLQDKERIRGVLDKVVSKDVADEILRTQIHLGGEDRIVTMLFSDIRGFTSLSEKETPQNTIHMLNACMTKISRVIEGEGGVIDKYVGDEVMAIYGAPTIHPDHALRAVSSGMLMIETLKQWNEERVRNGKPPIEMGIGVHTGLVVAGNMGAEDRLNYTVLGSNVNLAARLCEVAKRNQLIISEATLAEASVRESFHVKALDPIDLKGFEIPVAIFEVTGFKWDAS